MKTLRNTVFLTALACIFCFSVFAQTNAAEDIYSQRGNAVDPLLELYISNMAAAGALIQLNETKAAATYLENAPEKYRGWEWHYLRSQLDLSVKTLKGHKDRVASVAISPNGKTIASGSADKLIMLWDSESGKILKTLSGHEGQVSTLAFTPDGKQLVSGSTDKRVKVWDVVSGSEVRTISEGLSQGIYDVEVSPDGKWLAVGSWQLTGSQPPVEGFAKIFDLRSGKELKKYFMTAHPTSSVKFNSDGSTLTIGGWGFHIKTYDLNSDSLKLDIDIEEPARYTAIQSLAISPDDSKIIVGSKDQQIRIYDSKKGALLQKIDPFKGHKKFVNAVGFIGNGEFFVSGSQDNMIKVYETDTGEPKYELRGHTGGVNNLTVSQDGNYIISGSDDGTVKIWDTRSLERSQMRVCNDVGPWEMPLNEKSNRMVTTCAGEGIRIFDLQARKEIGKTDPEVFYFMDVDQTGKFMATGYEVNSLTIWDLANLKKVKTAQGHSKIILDLKFLPNNKYLVSSSADQTIRIWSYPDLRAVNKIEINDGVNVNSLSVSPDGSYIAVGTQKSGVIIWETKTWKEAAKLKAVESVSRVKFSADGSIIISAGTKGEVKLWDAKTFEPLHDLKGHTDRVNAIAISPDNKRVVTAGDDYTVRFWDTKSGANVLTLRGYPDQFFHGDFTGDGSTLILAEKHGLVRLLKIAGKNRLR